LLLCARTIQQVNDDERRKKTRKNRGCFVKSPGIKYHHPGLAGPEDCVAMIVEVLLNYRRSD
jgi:hypothetical protein